MRTSATIAIERQHGGHEDERDAPAEVRGEFGDERQEDELAGRRARRQHADDQAAAMIEPARRHRRRQHHGGEAGADADHHAPQQDELPNPRHRQRDQKTGRDQRTGGDDDAADAEAIHERGGERSEQSVQQDAQRQRRGDLRIAPAEFVLQRHDQHAGRAHRGGGDQHGEEGDGDDDPAVVDVAAGKRCGQCGRRHCVSFPL